MSIQLLILIFFAVIWIALRLLRRKPEDAEEQRGRDVIFTESEMNLPWEQMPQEQHMLEEEEEQVEEDLSVEREGEKKESVSSQPDSQPTPAEETKSETKQQEKSSMTSNLSERFQQRPGQPKQIMGIPLNTQNVKFGIILSEILNKPKSQRPKV